jgi:DNA-binding NarL/FixJ family response regulator
MNTRGDNPIHILVVAASSDRRASLAAMTVQATHARTTTLAALSVQRLLEIAPDLLLVDVDDPAISTAAIRAAEDLPAGTGLIALADNPDPHWVDAALHAGVDAILSREVTREELRVAILAAESGLVLLHPSSAQMLTRHSLAQNDSSEFMETLTAREQEVLHLVSEGLGNKAIAGRLDISEHTVKFHISSILGKLGAGSRTEAVRQGIRKGLITI